MICGDARMDGITVGVIANQRGLIKGREGEKPRFGGIVYTESAEKVAYFIDRCDRLGIPLLFVQDVSGFMVGTEEEQQGIIRAGAHFVEAMATARVPKIVLTINHELEGEGAKFVEAVSGGWPKVLSNLKSLLETGDVAFEV